MADPSRPLVPNARGVPPVNPPPGADPNGVPGVPQRTSDGPSIDRQTQPSWGVFNKDGQLALRPDSMREVEDTKEWNVPRYPLEGGGFQSFNKVEEPQEVHLVMTKGGTPSEKSTFVSAVDTLTTSLDLCSVITPEQTYRNMNLVRNSKNRTAEHGAGLISVELTFQEARISATTAFVDVKSPNGANNVNGGSVQTQTPTANQNPGVTPQ